MSDLPVFVGESNPYGQDPRYALFPLPIGSAGHRLQGLVCGVRRSTYVGFPRYDLCGAKWSIVEARATAFEIMVRHNPGVIVLLGRKVASAFGAGAVPSFTRFPRLDSRIGEYIVLPHPSGLCREWHKPGAFEQARALLREAAPHIRWGELGGPIRGSAAPTCGRCGAQIIADVSTNGAPVNACLCVPDPCENCGTPHMGNVCPECGPAR